MEDRTPYRGWSCGRDRARPSLGNRTTSSSDLIVPAYPAPEASGQAWRSITAHASSPAGLPASAAGAPAGRPGLDAATSSEGSITNRSRPLAPSKERAPDGAASCRPLDLDALLADAHRWVGVPYTLGRRYPRGVDCSGCAECSSASMAGACSATRGSGAPWHAGRRSRGAGGRSPLLRPVAGTCRRTSASPFARVVYPCADGDGHRVG